MSINGIGSYQLSASSLYAEQPQPANAVESDGDADRSRATAPIDNNGRNGLFSTAISQTLFQIGVTPAAANVATGAAPTGTQQQALTAFTQNLFGALQAAGSSNTPTASTKPGTPTRSNARASSAGASSGSTQIAGLTSGNTLQNRLQNLIQELGANSPGSSDSDDRTLAQLQQSFQNVLASQDTGSQPSTLTDFLQVLSQNLQDAPSSGSLINVQA